MKCARWIIPMTLLFLPLLSTGQNIESEWIKQMESPVFNAFSDVVENDDGTFTILGSINKKGPGGIDPWLVFLSAKGDTLKSATFPNEGPDIPIRLAKCEDGYLMAIINQSAADKQISWVIKAGQDGREVWRKSFPEQLVAGRTDIAVNTDGTWWWLNTTSAGNGTDAVMLCRMDASGEQTASYTFTEKQSLHAHSLRILPDQTIAVTGQTDLGKGNSSMWVMRVNQQGEKMWKTAVPITGRKISPECICCTPDNFMMIAGWTGSCMNPDAAPEDQMFDYDLLLTKVDGNGKIIWTKNYDREGSEGGNAIAVIADGNILIAGKCETSFTGTIGPWIMLVDKTGKKIADQVDKFRFSGDQASRIINTSDNGFLIVGPGNIDREAPRSNGWIRKLKPIL